MDRCEHIVHDQTLVQDDRVLVVVAFPRHEADQQVLAQRDFTVGCGRTVSDRLLLLDMLSLRNDRSLVDACSLVGALELQHMVDIHAFTIISGDLDGFRIYIADDSRVLRQLDDAGVSGRLVFDAGTDHRCFCHHERNSLSLHVGSHQRTVRVVVLQERDHGCRNGYDLLRGYVHIIDDLTGHQVDVAALASGRDLDVSEMTFGIQRLVGLCYDLIFFIVCRQIVDLIGDDAGFFVDDTIRCLDESVLVDDAISCQGTDQSDVRTFRSLDRAHTSVMGVMYVSDLESGTLSGKAAGAQRGKSSLMCQLCQRVGLVHELGQLGTSEEFLDRCCDRTDIHQALRCDFGDILCRHTLLDGTFHSGQTDTDLVLQQFADCTQSSVAQMVDVIGVADAVVQVQQVTDGRDDVRHQDMLRGQLELAKLQLLSDSRFTFCAVLLEDLSEDRIVHLVRDLQIGDIELDIVLDIDELVADDLGHRTFVVGSMNEYALNAGVLDLAGQLFADRRAILYEDLPGVRIDDGLSRDRACKTVVQSQLLVVFITADSRQVVSFRIKKHRVEQGLGALQCRRFTRSQFLVDFLDTFLEVRGRVLLKGLQQSRLLAEDLDDLFIAADPQRSQQDRCRLLTRSVHTDGQDLIGIGLILQPRASVRDHLCGVQVLTIFIDLLIIVGTGGTDQLCYDDTLRSIINERTFLGHQREVTHEDFLFLDLSALLIDQSDSDLQRSRVGNVSFFALLLFILRRICQRIVDEFQNEIICVSLDR